MIDKVLADAEATMQQAIDALKVALAAIQSPVASAAMFDPVRVDYFGTPTPLSRVATITVPEPRMAIVLPTAPSLRTAMLTAIRAALPAMTVSDDGTQIRVVLPASTAQQHDDLLKQAQRAADTARTAIRNAARKAKDALDRSVKDATASATDVSRAERDLDGRTQRYLAQVDLMLNRRTTELNR